MMKHDKDALTMVSYIPEPLDLSGEIMRNSVLETAEADCVPNLERYKEDIKCNNIVTRSLLNEPELPPITLSNWYKEVNWPQATLLCLEPLIALYGLLTTSLVWQTFAFSVVWYILTFCSINAGYHRLLAHRAYEATALLRYILFTFAAGSVQGSAKWWARGHRAHHRYTDTDLDPYSAHKGLLHSHIGWMIFKPRRKPGTVDVADLDRDKCVQWQHRNYVTLALLMSFVIPTLVCGLGWGDYRGGFFFASVLRLVIIHHSTFCVNSLAHYLGETTFDDKHTPRDHFITALLTFGEGYHNFHHEFPSDYRNGIEWYQYDPIKLLIKLFSMVGLASNLKEFPYNEIQKGRHTMLQKNLDRLSQSIIWPKSASKLPVISFDQYQQLAKRKDGRCLVLIAGFIHDVNKFIESHPGGQSLLKHQVGKDATVAFYGGVHDHNNTAHNVLAMMRVAVCKYGGEVVHAKKRVGIL